MQDDANVAPKLVVTTSFEPTGVNAIGAKPAATITISAGKRTHLTARRPAEKEIVQDAESSDASGLTLRMPSAARGAAAASSISASPSIRLPEAVDPTTTTTKDPKKPEEERKRKRRLLAGYFCCCFSAAIVAAVLLGVLLSAAGGDGTVVNGGGGNKVQTSAAWVRAELPLVGGSGVSSILSSSAFADSPEPFGILLRQAVASAVGIVPSSVQLQSVSVNATSLPELLTLLGQNTTSMPASLLQLFAGINITTALSALPVSANNNNNRNWTFETGTWSFSASHYLNADAFAPLPLPARRRMMRRLSGSSSNGNESVANCTNVTVQVEENDGEAIPVTYVRLQLLLPAELVSAGGGTALDAAAAAYLRAILSFWGNATSTSASSLRTVLSSWENCTSVPASISEQLMQETAPNTVDVVAEVIQERDTTTNTVTIVSVVPSPSITPSSSPTPTRTPTPSPTSSTTPTASVGSVPLTSPTATLSAVATESATATSSSTGSSSASASSSASSSASATSSSSASSTSSSSATATSSSSPSASDVPASAQSTFSSSASSSATSSSTATSTTSPSSSSTATSSSTSTASSTATSSTSATSSSTAAASMSATATATPSSTTTTGGAGAASCPNVAPTSIDAFAGSGETSWTAVAFDTTDDAYYVSSSAILIKREKSSGKRWVLADLTGTVSDMLMDTRSNTLYMIKDSAIFTYNTAGTAIGSSFTISGCSSPVKFAWDASWNMIIGCNVYTGSGFQGKVVRVNPSSPGSVTTLVSQTAWVAFETAANGNNGGFSSLAVDMTNSVMYVADFWGSIPMQRFTTAGGSNTALKMMGSNLNGQNAGWYAVAVDPVTGKVYGSWSAPYPATVGGITYYAGLYAWPSATGSQTTTITRTAGTRLCCGSLNIHYNNSVGYIYGSDMRMPLPTSSEPNAPMEAFLTGWSNVAGYVATDTYHYIASQRYTGIIITAPDATKVGGGISWALTTSLTSPRQICGINAGSLYVIDSGTSIKAVDLTTGSVTTYVTGLTDVWTCSMDAGGTGDILLVDGYVIKRVPAGSTAPFPSSSLTTVFTLNVQHTGILLPILSIAGDVSKSLYLVSTPGNFDNVNTYTALSNSGILRIKNSVETVIGVGTQTDYGPIWNADGTRFACGLFLTSSGELYITSPTYTLSLAYVKATDVTTASAFSTKWLALGNGAAYGPFVSATSSGKIYTANGGIVQKAC